MPLNFTSPVDSAMPLPGSPSQPRKKPVICHMRVEAEAARHDRIADEMAGEEPEVRLDVEFGADEALVEFAAGLADLGDAVEHQHRRIGQLRIAGAEQFAAGAGQQILIAVAGLLFRHQNLFPSHQCRAAGARHCSSVSLSQSVSSRKPTLALIAARLAAVNVPLLIAVRPTEYMSKGMTSALAYVLAQRSFGQEQSFDG